ncbi:phage tail tube protein [Flagellatimonas centrodinii]|uniref:phage tail tube protein n=1 Tax=Flagellatimonas centrodinii TaxID=2806210 RepID=UPI001FF023F2|nr:phage tail tube protein [Flagellatimonas centrodinii]ULQ45872.1 phage tail tube protein [Flagellatimonas centrodinii]
MADTAFIGYGSIFERGVGSPLVYAEIARVTEINPPSLSRETSDVTHLKSTDRYKEFIGAMRDAGEVSFTLIYNPANTTHQSLMTDYEANAAVDYRITFSDDDTWQWSFKGFVTGLETPITMEDKVTQSITIKITGKPTLAASGS